jgi:glycosyltransferase involved in cell wall biosynthesis
VKILQVISSFPPAYSYGGPLGVTYRVSKELARRGHQVTVFTTDLYDSKSRLPFERNPVTVEGIEVYHFRNISNYLAVHQKVVAAPSMALELRKRIESFDLIHVREYFSFLTPVVHHYATKKNTPYILQAHGSLQRTFDKQDSAYSSKKLAKKVFDVLFGYSLLKDAASIIATSRIESDQFCEVSVDFPFDKVVYLPNQIDLRSYEHLPAKGTFRRKYNIDENAKIALFLSRIHEAKGADLLLVAFSKVKKAANFPFKLVIAGPDEGYLQIVKSLARKLRVGKDVVFPGPLYEGEKLEAYVDADVFVLPSRYESFGNVVLEALACGTPVIVTNNCGVSEWIGPNVGFVIGYDQMELCKALKAILQNEQLAKRFGDNGKKLINKEFGWDKGILQLEELYEVVAR